ncbi:MAG: hypothetical protein GY805_14990 [Chloroflexi bacterium]|nr:hypothetical protein [Chloroflexota bacterium]
MPDFGLTIEKRPFSKIRHGPVETNSSSQIMVVGAMQSDLNEGQQYKISRFASPTP